MLSLSWFSWANKSQLMFKHISQNMSRLPKIFPRVPRETKSDPYRLSPYKPWLIMYRYVRGLWMLLVLDTFPLNIIAKNTSKMLGWAVKYRRYSLFWGISSMVSVSEYLKDTKDTATALWVSWIHFKSIFPCKCYTHFDSFWCIRDGL